jgi:hypothetical protein
MADEVALVLVIALVAVVAVVGISLYLTRERPDAPERRPEH